MGKTSQQSGCRRVSQWLRRDLPHRVEALSLPVTLVTAKGSERASAPASGR